MDDIDPAVPRVCLSVRRRESIMRQTRLRDCTLHSTAADHRPSMNEQQQQQQSVDAAPLQSTAVMRSRSSGDYNDHYDSLVINEHVYSPCRQNYTKE